MLKSFCSPIHLVFEFARKVDKKGPINVYRYYFIRPDGTFAELVSHNGFGASMFYTEFNGNIVWYKSMLDDSQDIFFIKWVDWLGIK